MLSIAIPAKHRWIGYLMALAVTLVAVKWAGGQDRSKPPVLSAQPVNRTDQQSAREAGTEAIPIAAPKIQLDKLALARNGRLVSTGDPFQVSSWEEIALQETSRSSSPSPPPPPQPPALPFTYMGRLLNGDTTIVFLANQDRNYVVRAGDTLEGIYGVETIEEAQLVLNYLPLGIHQALSFSSADAAAATPQVLARPRVPAIVAKPGVVEPVSLVFSAPARATVGQEFVVNLGLPAGSEGAKASIELTYDPSVFNVLRRPSPGAPATPDPGRALVDVVGPEYAGVAAAPTTVRFRVVGKAPTTAQINIESVSATDGAGLGMSLSAPSSHSVSITSAGGTQ